MILSTAQSLEGYRVVKQCGVVYGEIVFNMVPCHVSGLL